MRSPAESGLSGLRGIGGSPLDIISEVGTFVSPATATTQAIPLTAGIWGGKAPKVFIPFFSNYAGEADSVVAGMNLGFGIGVSSTSRAAIAINSTNAAIAADASRRHDNANVITRLSAPNTVSEAADLTSFAGNQINITWSSATASAEPYKFLALGGDDLTGAYLHQIGTPTSTGEVSYTDVPFQPTGLIQFGIGAGSTPPANADWAQFQLGVTDFSSQYALSIDSKDGADPTQTYRRISSSRFIQSGFTSGKVPSDAASVVSANSDGYTLNWLSADGSSRPVFVLCLRGPRFKVSSYLQPTSNSSVTRNIGFRTRASLVFTGMSTRSDNTTENGSFMGIGAWDDSNGMAFAGAADENGVADTNSDRVDDSNEMIKHIDNAQLSKGSMSLSADGNDVIEAWTDCDGTQREHVSVSIGG